MILDTPSSWPFESSSRATRTVSDLYCGAAMCLCPRDDSLGRAAGCVNHMQPVKMQPIVPSVEESGIRSGDWRRALVAGRAHRLRVLLTFVSQTTSPPLASAASISPIHCIWSIAPSANRSSVIASCPNNLGTRSRSCPTRTKPARASDVLHYPRERDIAMKPVRRNVKRWKAAPKLASLPHQQRPSQQTHTPIKSIPLR